MEKVDKIIIGAGIFGLYAAYRTTQHKEKVVVIEYEKESFSRATLVNQGRIHNGYHYPRSLSTALHTARYFQRFSDEFDFCIHKDFTQIYATAKAFSWVNARQFSEFCRAAKIRCQPVDSNEFFREDCCDGIFTTQEYSFDAHILKGYFLKKIGEYQNGTIRYQSRINKIYREKDLYVIELKDGTSLATPFILNATYANINWVQAFLGFQPFKIHYEICEIVLCKVSEPLKDIGITVMDGPFFSLMPFGKTGYHSLSAVTYTPHKSYAGISPRFDCQKKNETCNENQLANCNDCIHRPESNWPKMYQLAKKYLREEIDMTFTKSMFTMKAVLVDAEIDDSRPTIIRRFSEKPYFYSVFSGKINAIYELDDILVKY